MTPQNKTQELRDKELVNKASEEALKASFYDSPKRARDEAAEKYCVGATDGEPYSEYEGHFYKAGWSAREARLLPMLKMAIEALEFYTERKDFGEKAREALEKLKREEGEL